MTHTLTHLKHMTKRWKQRWKNQRLHRLTFPPLVAYLWAAFFIPSAQAQIPVTDGAAISNSKFEHIETMAKWLQQIAEMKNQLEEQIKLYKSLTGSRNLGDIFNNPQLREYLPQEWRDVYDEIRDGGYGGLTGDAQSIYDSNQRYDGCQHLSGDHKTVCERRAVKGAQDKAFSVEAYDRAMERIEQIESLMNAINGTEDAKAIAELQARIAVEQAQIQNEQTKLQLYQMAAAAEDRLMEQQQAELAQEALSKRGVTQPKPVKFK